MENVIENKDSSFLSHDSLHSLKDERKNSQDYTKSHPKKCDTATKEKHLTGFLKQSFRTLSVPKKSQSEKDKNDSSRFVGEGVTFKAKLIGVLEVDEARGDRMCQEALFELKMAVRVAGEHKQRINIVIAIDGIRLRDEKSGDCLHHHPVHKISFIAQDVADSRAFGYIFGSPDTSHRFFGIKTDKAASQVVMAMRDLFQAVYELKKREVEMAKQNIEQHQLKYGSSLFLDSISASSSKSGGGVGGSGNIEAVVRTKPVSVARDEANKSTKNKTQTAGVIADLMDLELELNSLQQGLSHMERLTPCDPFGPSPSLAKEDPFGDSFTPPPCITTPPPTKLPPPPTTGDRRKVGSTSSTASQPELHWFDKETQDLFSSEKNLTGVARDAAFDKDKKSECAATSRPEVTSKDLYDIFTELDPLGTGRSKPYTDKKDFFQEQKNPPKRQLRDLRGGESVTDGSNLSTCFAGTSKSLFSEDNPSEKHYDERFRKFRSVDSAPASAPPTDHRITLAEELAKCDTFYESSSASASAIDPFETSFANFAAFSSHNGGGGGGGGSSAFDESQPRRSPLSQLHQHHRRSPASHAGHSQHHSSLQNIIGSGGGGGKLSSSSSSSKSMYKPALNALADDLPAVSSQTTDSFLQRHTPPHWTRPAEDRSKQKIVINLRKVLSNGDDTDKENDSPVLEEATILRNPDATSPGRGGNASSDSFESIPEPPPRPVTSPIASQPPPLPPKKLQLPITMKPPPPQRPASSDALSHYDYIENYQSLGGGGSSRHQHKQQQRLNGDVQIPPLPAPARKPKFAHEYEHDTVARHRPHKQAASGAAAAGRPSRAIEPDYYLTPIARAKDERGRVRPSLNITISQLTSTGFEDLATMLCIPASALSKMTLKELTECLSRLSDAECQKLEQDMNHVNHHRYEDARYKYRSLNESFDAGEDESPVAATAGFKANFEERFPPKAAAAAAAQVDKYAVFRELIEQEELNSSAQPRNADDADAEPEYGQRAPDIADQSPKIRDPEDGVAGSGEPTKELTASEQEEQDRYAALRSISPSKAKAEVEESGGDVSQESRDADEAAREHDASGGSEEDGGAIGGGGSAAEDAETVENGDDAVAMAAVPSQTDGGATVERTSVAETHAAAELGRDWAKFDNELDGRDEEPRLTTSPWRDERNKDSDFTGSRDADTKPATAARCRKKGPRRKGWSQVGYDEDEDEEEEDEDDEDEGMVEDDDELDEDADYGDDSEEEKEDWESSKRSVASSWDESSWRENGWSDRDSLYDDAEASPAPAASQAAYRLQPPYPKKGYHRRYGGSSGPPRKPTTAEHSPWEEAAPGWLTTPRKPAYKEYGSVKVERERGYDERKTRTPPWSAGGGSERKRYETKGDDEDEEDELMLLKMMLGKKRLMALEEQLFKHYHERLSEAPAPSYYSHRAAAATAATMTAPKLADKEKGGRAAAHGKKYYTAQRPKSADKGRGKPWSLRPPEDTEELFATNEKYRRPYSQDELSISEEERWSHKSPLAFKRSAAPRSRHHSQTSPFEDNFAPHAYEFADTPPPPSETTNASSTTVVTAASSKSKNAPPPSLSTLPSRYKKSTATDAKKLQQQQPVELHPYSAYDFKSGRSSRESSQRQSPFEDDFTPPETSQQPQQYVSDSGTADLAVGPRGSRSAMTARASRANRYEHARRAAGSAGAERPGKYYENVELWKKTPSAAAIAAAAATTSGSASESYYEKATAAGKDKYKHAAAAMKESNGGEGTGDTRSPRKTSKHHADCRRHDPFNDNATGYESRTMPRLQKAKSKSKIQMYDSGSDSPETGRGAATGGGSTGAAVGAVKWKEDVSSFAFGEQQQHSRK